MAWRGKAAHEQAAADAEWFCLGKLRPGLVRQGVDRHGRHGETSRVPVGRGEVRHD
jgi:hypothetical protein